MGPWWLYILVFAFGYLTHKTFYFFRSIKISINLIKISQLISLAVLAKSMENFYYAHTSQLRKMREDGSSEKDIKDLRRSFNLEISNYKERAIKEILDSHPSFYEPLVHFDNWKSAMKYLNEHSELTHQLINQDKND